MTQREVYNNNQFKMIAIYSKKNKTKQQQQQTSTTGLFLNIHTWITTNNILRRLYFLYTPTKKILLAKSAKAEDTPPVSLQRSKAPPTCVLVMTGPVHLAEEYDDCIPAESKDSSNGVLHMTIKNLLKWFQSLTLEACGETFLQLLQTHVCYITYDMDFRFVPRNPRVLWQAVMLWLVNRTAWSGHSGRTGVYRKEPTWWEPRSQIKRECRESQSSEWHAAD